MDLERELGLSELSIIKTISTQCLHIRMCYVMYLVIYNVKSEYFLSIVMYLSVSHNMAEIAL